MLHEFITHYRDDIITRARQKLTDRPLPLVSTSELEFGVPLFLTQLSETLRDDDTPTLAPDSQQAIGVAAARHGRQLRALGFNISQVVHDYGDICQAITEVAMEQNIPISNQEFHLLNRCLDTAIAEAVTEHANITAAAQSAEETERAGQLAHEQRDILNSALLAFHALRRGAVAINGSTGTVLGRSLVTLRDLVERSLTTVRIKANVKHPQRVPIALLLDEVALTANLHAKNRELCLVVAPIDPMLLVNADPQLLSSAVMNLLNNAFKFTPAGGTVMLRAIGDGVRVRIEVEDQCGGLPADSEDLFRAFATPRKGDSSGLGLGLSIASKAVRMHGGTISVRDQPSRGCVFEIELPLASNQLSS